jgi:LAGLIDADG DNA endonuclease family protein
MNASRFNYSSFYTKNLPKLIKIPKEPSFNDAWLSGFTDAEGCFSVKIENRYAARIKNMKTAYVKLLFILDQKNEEIVLNKIALLFNSFTKAKLRTINKCKTNQSLLDPVNFLKVSNIYNNMFRITFSCNDKKGYTVVKLFNYFDKYSLKTSKKKSYQI